jgi:hypothetical protein
VWLLRACYHLRPPACIALLLAADTATILVLPLFERPKHSEILSSYAYTVYENSSEQNCVFATVRVETAPLYISAAGIFCDVTTVLLEYFIIVAIVQFVLFGMLLLYTARLLRVKKTGLRESKYFESNHCEKSIVRRRSFLLTVGLPYDIPHSKG